MAYILHNTRSANDALAGLPLAAPLEMLLETAMREHALQSLVVIVPTGRRVRLLKRTIVRQMFALYGKPVSDIPVFTLENFVKHCAEEFLQKQMPRVLSEGYTATLMEEAAERAAAEKKLSFFTHGGSRYQSIAPVVLERLTNIILGLKEDGITPESLRNDLSGGGEEITDARRLADIAALYEMYEHILGTTLADYPRLLRVLTDALTADKNTTALGSRWRTLFPAASMLVLDGFTEFKKPEERFLAALYHAPFAVRIVLDYSERNGPLFGGLQDTLAALQGFTGAAVPDSPEDLVLVPQYTAYSTDTEPNELFQFNREEHLPRASYLRRWLFNTDEDIRHGGFNDTVRVVGFETRADETRSIARLIRHLVLKSGVPLDKICVVMHQPEMYSSLFREMFALYSIPANITDRFPLEKSPVVTAIFSVLDMLLLGFRRDDVHRALQSPYLRFSRMERIAGKKRPVPLNAANLFTVAGRLRISGGKRFGRHGKEHWLRRMDSRLAYLSKREILLNQDPNADLDELAETRRFREEIELALQDFQALSTIIRNEEQRFTPAEFNAFVKEEILQRLHVRERIVEFNREAKELANALQISQAERAAEFLRLEEEVEKDARALAAFVELLDEMTAIMEERDAQTAQSQTLSHQAPSNQATKPQVIKPQAPSNQVTKQRTLEEYAERLKTAVRNARYQIREKLGYGVTVTSLEQIRGIPFAVTIVCGALDGEFPRRYVPESFLGKELLSSEERFLQRERVQFYQALCNNAAAFEDASKRVFITYPMFHEENELVRSSFVDALLKITSLHQEHCVVNTRTYRLEYALRQSMSDINSSIKPEDRAWIHAAVFGIASEEEAVRTEAVKRAAALEQPHYAQENFPQSQNTLENGQEFSMYSVATQQDLKRVMAHIERKFSQEYDQTAVSIEYAAIPEKDNNEAVNNEAVSPLAKRSYSVSVLEQYKRCPYQYFSARVLNLREVQEFETSLSPLESGSLLHRILYRFYREIQAEHIHSGEARILCSVKADVPDIALVRLAPDNEAEYQATLRRIAEEEISAIRFDHPFFELDKEALLGSSSAVETSNETRNEADAASQLETLSVPRGKLEVWLHNELERQREGWFFAPGLFEFGFGERAVQGRTSPLGSVELTESLRLRGKIDRIEFFEQPGGSVEFMIADYKSGSKVAGNNEIRKGTSLQMPLYAEAAQKILREVYNLNAEPMGMVYYILSPKATESGKASMSHQFVLLPQDAPMAAFSNVKPSPKSAQLVPNHEAAQSLIQQSVYTAEEYAQHISEGLFPIEPLDNPKPCGYCAYKSVCRIAEIEQQRG